MYVYDNVLNDKECEFLIRYFNRHYNNEENTGNNFSRILTLTLNTNWRTVSWTHWFHIRVNLIRRKCLRRVMEEIPLKLQYAQVVHWSSGSFLDLHYDIDYPHEGEGSVNDFVTVCYLNDNFEGGETVLDYNDMKPKRGKLIAFPSKEILHGVKPVRGDRYTHIAWWRISNAN